jgi:hypothetical protein
MLGSRSGACVSQRSPCAATDARARFARSYGGEFRSMTAWDRHCQLVNDYINVYGGKLSDFEDKTPKLTDEDILKRSYRLGCGLGGRATDAHTRDRFVRTEADDREGTYDSRLAKRYYDKLFKVRAVASGAAWRAHSASLKRSTALRTCRVTRSPRWHRHVPAAHTCGLTARRPAAGRIAVADPEGSAGRQGPVHLRQQGVRVKGKSALV